MHLAAEKGHIDIVQSLIKAEDIDANIKDYVCVTLTVYCYCSLYQSGRMPIHYAVINNNSIVLELLLKQEKIDYNAQDCVC